MGARSSRPIQSREAELQWEVRPHTRGLRQGVGGPADRLGFSAHSPGPDLEDVEAPLFLHHHTQRVRHIEEVRHLRKTPSQLERRGPRGPSPNLPDPQSSGCSHPPSPRHLILGELLDGQDMLAH